MSEEQLQDAPAEDVKNNSDAGAKTSNEGAGLAPVEPEKVDFSDEQQKIFNGAIGKKTKQLRDAERELQTERERNQQLQSQIPKAEAPAIPELPDKYDFDSDAEYFEAQRKRDEAIRQTVEFESHKKATEQQNAVLQQNALQDQQRKQVESENKMIERAGVNGITQDDLLKAAKVLGEYSLDGGIANAIIDDKDGDVIIMHLANNPIEADELSRLSPFDAARMIDTSIREKAQKFKPSSSGAPDPSKEIQGKGGGADQNTVIAGAIFE